MTLSMKQRLQDQADIDEYGPHVHHFDCAKFLQSVHRVGIDPIVFGMKGEEVWPAVYDGLIGDPFSDVRTDIAEHAADRGLAILFASLLKRRVHLRSLPYEEVNNLKMTAASYKDVMTGPVYSVVRDYMKHAGVDVINDADSFLVQ